MKLRIIAAVAVAVALAGTVGFAQQQGRVIHNTYTDEWEGVFLYGCDGGAFDVMNRYEVSVNDATRYDQNGQPVQLIEQIKWITDVFWNSATGKSLTGGPGENVEIRRTFVNGAPVISYESGPVVRINLPGYGPIYVENGLTIYDPSTFEILFDSGHNDLFGGDPAGAEALCNALK